MLKQTKITDYFKPVQTIKEIKEQVNLEYLHNRCVKMIEMSNLLESPQYNLRILTEYILAIGDKLKNT